MVGVGVASCMLVAQSGSFGLLGQPAIICLPKQSPISCPPYIPFIYTKLYHPSSSTRRYRSTSSSHTSCSQTSLRSVSSLISSPEGTLNAAYNCLDRHFYANPDKTAIIYEADEASESREISFRELMKETCQIANVLKGWGIKKGDAVSI